MYHVSGVSGVCRSEEGMAHGQFKVLCPSTKKMRSKRGCPSEALGCPVLRQDAGGFPGSGAAGAGAGDNWVLSLFFSVPGPLRDWSIMAVNFLRGL